MKRKLLFIATQLLTLTTIIIWVVTIMWTIQTVMIWTVGFALITTNLIVVGNGLYNWWQNHKDFEAWKGDVKRSMERQIYEMSKEQFSYFAARRENAEIGSAKNPKNLINVKATVRALCECGHIQADHRTLNKREICLNATCRCNQFTDQRDGLNT